MIKAILLFFFIIINISISELFEIQIETRVEEPEKKHLKADLHSADTNSAKPAILIQTPYNKALMRLFMKNPQLNPEFQLPVDYNDYHYVIMDWRGFYANTDKFLLQKEKGEDGYDAVEWIASQSWCNGKVGTWGGSALGQVQFETIRANPPHLDCSVPFIKEYQTSYDDYFYGGAFRQEHIENFITLGFIENLDIILNNPSKNNTWKYIEQITDYPNQLNVPMLMVTGWFDHYPGQIIKAFHDVAEKSLEEIRHRHKFIVGPWLHSFIGNTKQGILEFPEATNFSRDATEKFFDYFLLGAKNGWPLEPKIQYFQIGENKWYETDDWYNLPGTKLEMFLHPGGELNDYPVPVTFVEVPPDTIIFDPRDPSPAIGGARFIINGGHDVLGPQDMRQEVESRDDNLIYTTHELESDIAVRGVVSLELFVQSDREDTDFAFRLCDVYPDGRSIIMRQGIKRARFRETLESESLLVPGEVYKIIIELDDLAITFKKGHKIRIIVTSSIYPMFAINPNNGETLYWPGDTLTAENLVYANSSLQSKLVLPVVPMTDVENSEFPEVVLHPNPASEYINISGIQNHYGEVYEIYSSIGEPIQKGIVISSKIDVSNLYPGLYLITIDGVRMGKFLKH